MKYLVLLVLSTFVAGCPGDIVITSDDDDSSAGDDDTVAGDDDDDDSSTGDDDTVADDDTATDDDSGTLEFDCSAIPEHPSTGLHSTRPGGTTTWCSTTRGR